MNPSSAQAKRWVITALVIAVIVTETNNIAKGEPPSLRAAVGGLFAGIVLTLMAEVAPEMAAGFAALIATGAVLTKGNIFTDFTNWLGKQSQTKGIIV